mmetsp:Transcript_39181/g.123510  ORF Transcript_39181/g.123510 Transcript_39181/m.123510 type:complete len:227 (+) Transcript_39181:1019-1699(+)
MRFSIFGLILSIRASAFALYSASFSGLMCVGRRSFTVSLMKLKFAMSKPPASEDRSKSEPALNLSSSHVLAAAMNHSLISSVNFIPFTLPSASHTSPLDMDRIPDVALLAISAMISLLFLSISFQSFEFTSAVIASCDTWLARSNCSDCSNSARRFTNSSYSSTPSPFLSAFHRKFSSRLISSSLRSFPHLCSISFTSSGCSLESPLSSEARNAFLSFPEREVTLA